MEGQVGLVHSRRLAFKPKQWNHAWRRVLASTKYRPDGSIDDTAPARKRAEMPRHLAAWVLRRAGVGTQTIGYLLAHFRLISDAGLDAAALASPTKPEQLDANSMRRLGKAVDRSLQFWRRLETARLRSGGAPFRRDPLGPAPESLLLNLQWHVRNERTPIPDHFAERF